MDMEAIAALLRDQDGVIGRFQLIAAGARKHDLERLLRRRDLVRFHDGVYLDHTGRPSHRQLEVAAVLRYWPAALASFSALDLDAWQRPPHVIIDMRRNVGSINGIAVSRSSRFAEAVAGGSFPPRQRIEDAALMAASSLERADQVFTFLSDVVQSRKTTAGRLISALEQRPRVARRALLDGVLADLGSGNGSILEREWMRLERLHGLPHGVRQDLFRIEGVSGARDVHYRPFGVVVELDGRAFHGTAAARDADSRRDLLAAAEGGALTLRLTYGQVFRDPCRTIDRVARVLKRRGWTSSLRRCRHC